MVFLSLGSNIGNRRNNLLYAIGEIKKNRLTSVEKVSSFYETLPVGEKRQPYFINAVLKIKTKLPPEGLLFFVKSIEKKMGRVKFSRRGPRNIDIDIIFYDDLNIKKRGLIIPHPEVENRPWIKKLQQQL